MLSDDTLVAWRRIVEHTARRRAAHPQVTVTPNENGAA
jgi:hypothetical protein